MQVLKTIYLHATFLLLTGFALAQNVTLQSYKRAKTIFNQSLNAYGGLNELLAVDNISLVIDGTQHHRNQSRKPGVIDTTPRNYDVVFDLKGNRYRMLLDRGGVGRDLVRYVDIFDGKERVFINPFNNTKTVRSAMPNWKEQYTSLFLPQYLLVYASKRLAQLRYLGTAMFNNRPHELLGLPGADGSSLTMYIDAATKMISKYETLQSDEFAGDAVNETIFPVYRKQGKWMVPVTAITKIGGVVTSELRYRQVHFNRLLNDADFGLKTDANPAPAATPPSAAVEKLGENIYLTAAGGYRVLFADFKDHVWVMEAPAGEASSQVIGKINETLPGKPIKYVAITHFHIDHSGGLRAYIAEGATVVTTKGNRGYFEQLAKAVFSIAPDALSNKPQVPKMEFVEKKRVFTDGATTIELYDIGLSPHVEELLVAYLPKEKILFEADVFDGPLDGRTKSNQHFAKWIAAKGLAVEKIIPVHGTIVSWAEFEAAMAALTQMKKE